MPNNFLYHYLTEWSFLQLLLLLFLVTGYSIIGRFFGKLFLERTWLLFFCSVLTGLFISITLYAAVKTHGFTVLILLIIPAVFLVRNYIGNKLSWSLWKENGIKIVKLFLYILPVSTIFFSIQFFILYNTDTTFLYKIQNWDYTYYYSFIESLRHAGIENSNGTANFFDSTWHGNTAYHFSELWLAAMSGDLFSVSSMVSFKLFTFVFFQLIFFVGLISLCERHFTVSIKHIAVCLLVLFSGGIYLEVYSLAPNLEAVKYLADNHIMGYGNIKYGPLYIFTISIVLALNYKQYFLSWVLLASLPLLFISVWPAITGGIFLYAIWYRYKYGFNKNFIRYSIVPLILYTSLGLFYWITGTNENNSVNSWDELLIVFVKDMPLAEMTEFLLKKIIIVFLFFPFKYLLAYLFWILLLMILWKQNSVIKNIILHHKDTFILSICILFAGLVAFLFWYINKDALQMFINVAFPIFNVGIAIMCIWIFCSDRNHGWTRVAPVLLLLFSVFNQYRITVREHDSYNTYSDSYLSKINEWSSTLPKLSKGAFIGGEDFFGDDNFFKRKPTLHILGNYITFTPLLLPVSLSIYDTPEGKTPEENINIKRYKQSSVFYRFAEQNEFSTIDAAQTVFVVDYKLRYLIVGKGGKFPEGMKDLILKQTTDPLSGESFFLLKE